MDELSMTIGGCSVTFKVPQHDEESGKPGHSRLTSDQWGSLVTQTMSTLSKAITTTTTTPAAKGKPSPAG
jgi:hypothetical protein